MIARKLVEIFFELPPGKALMNGLKKAAQTTATVSFDGVIKSIRFAKEIKRKHSEHKKSATRDE